MSSWHAAMSGRNMDIGQQLTFEINSRPKWCLKILFFRTRNVFRIKIDVAAEKGKTENVHINERKYKIIFAKKKQCKCNFQLKNKKTGALRLVFNAF